MLGLCTRVLVGRVYMRGPERDHGGGIHRPPLRHSVPRVIYFLTYMETDQ